MKRLVCLSILLLTSAAGAAAAQDSVQTVRDLYASASYEEALAAADRLRAEPPQREVERYRVLALTALARVEEAQQTMEAIVSADPLYVLDPADTPPRVQERFREVRRRLLPDLAMQLYLDARAALDGKDRAGAIGRFERLLAVIDASEGVATSLGDLRILAAGFLDLSRALPEPAAPAPPADAPEPSPEVAVAAVVEARPIAVRQELPPWFPADAVTRRTAYSGAVLVRVGPSGQVESAEIMQSVHPSYDNALIEAARDWVYEPARRNGVPVAADITVEVNLQPSR